jgi:hypothetical protein
MNPQQQQQRPSEDRIIFRSEVERPSNELTDLRVYLARMDGKLDHIGHDVSRVATSVEKLQTTVADHSLQLTVLATEKSVLGGMMDKLGKPFLYVVLILGAGLLGVSNVDWSVVAQVFGAQ